METFTSEIERVQAAALSAMEQSMTYIEADTKQLCPVKTGHLKRSYQSGAEQDGAVITGYVGSDCEYAIWADLKQPHLTTAVEKDRAAVENIIQKALSTKD